MNPSTHQIVLRPLLRQLRRPVPSARLLSRSHSPLLLVARSPARPRPSFLSRTQQLPTDARLLSTETVASIKYQIQLGIYWVAITATIMAAGSVVYFVFREDWLDKQFPSPSEWSFWVKQVWRDAHYEQFVKGPDLGLVSWGRVASRWRYVVAYLENGTLNEDIVEQGYERAPEKGALPKQADWDRSIPGLTEELMRSPPEGPPLTRIGRDASAKSELWRQGYFEAMLNTARGAEQQFGWMLYKPTKMVVAPRQVRSATNPHPSPFPPGSGLENPDEKDCVLAFESPDYHYIRLLTTRGFNRKQRIEAGINYAHWLDQSDKPAQAEAIYDWCLKLASEGLDDANRFVNVADYTIAKTAPYVTPNLLTVTTQMASHYARNEQISKSLGIYLSVLRARRSAPEAPPREQYVRQKRDLSLRTPGSLRAYVTSLFTSPEYSLDTKTGDEAFVRTKSAACDEAVVGAYMGEILFARANRHSEGLAWTRDAARAAETGYQDEKLDQASRNVCTECFDTALGNWQRMVQQMAQNAQQAKPPAKSSWLWSKREEKQVDWDEELQQITRKKQKFDEDRLNKRLAAMVSYHSKMFAF